MATQPNADWGPALNANRLKAGYAPMPDNERVDKTNVDGFAELSSAPVFWAADYDFHHSKESETGV